MAWPNITTSCPPWAATIYALHFKDIVGGSKEDAEARLSTAGGAPAGEPGAPSGNTALEKYTVNFTARARAGEIDPVFCRDREIRQAIDILGRRRKNNPIFVGEAGVGKTAVVEGLALKIVEGDVPDIFKERRNLRARHGLVTGGRERQGRIRTAFEVGDSGSEVLAQADHYFHRTKRTP